MISKPIQLKKYINLFDFKQKVDYKTEVLSGLTVAIALIPEAVAFALIAGLSPLTGLYAAFVMGLITSILGGRPGMISGATGAVAVVIVALAISHGPEYIFATVVLAGILQVTAGVLRLGKLMRLVPHPVIFGFVNGLAIIIFMSQLAQFKDNNGDWLTGSSLAIFLGLVVLTMLIIWGLPKLTKVIPSSLMAILTISGIVIGFGIDTKTVGDIASIQGGFPPFHIPNVPVNLETLVVIFPYAAIVAGVGLIESLLTLNIVDEITETRGRGNKEAVAQGAANILSGFFSGMGGCAMIGQSVINVKSGGRTRLSTLLAGILLLIFAVFLGEWVGMIPMAALVAVMIMVSIGTFNWQSVRDLTTNPKSSSLVMIITVLVVVFTHNLAYGVFVGVLMSALFFANKVGQLLAIQSELSADGNSRLYWVTGQVFFTSAEPFVAAFDFKEPLRTVQIDLTHAHFWDITAVSSLDKVILKFRKAGIDAEVIGLNHASATLVDKFAIHNKPEAIEQLMH